MKIMLADIDWYFFFYRFRSGNLIFKANNW